MKTVSLAEAKRNLRTLIDGVKAGTPVLIMDHDQAVARLEPIATDNENGRDPRIARLVAQGLARPERAALPPGFFTRKLPHIGDGKSVVAALINERRHGR